MVNFLYVSYILREFFISQSILKKRRNSKILYVTFLFISLTMLTGCSLKKEDEKISIDLKSNEESLLNNQPTITLKESNSGNSQQNDSSNILTNLSLDTQKKEDDNIEIITKLNDTLMPEKIILKVVLGNQKRMEKIYEGNWLATVYTADLLSDGTEEIILSLQNTTSNYASSEVHVLKVNNDNLNEILTIIDGPDVSTILKTDTYDDSLFLIPWPKDNFGLPDEYAQDYALVCSGGMPVNIAVNGNTNVGIKISHWNGMPQSNTYYSLYGKEVYPYSIIIWTDKGWIVTEQGTDNNWFLENSN